MNESESHLDLRQQKTRKLLVDALISLLQQKPFSQLSVTDICQTAMVHRTTFYAHFSDKQELLHYMLHQLEQECIDTCLPQGTITNPREYFLIATERVLDFLSARHTLYKACVDSGASTAAHMLEDYAAQELCQRISQPQFQKTVPHIHPEIAARFYAGAMLSLIRWWLSSDVPVTKELLLQNFSYFLPSYETQREG